MHVRVCWGGVGDACSTHNYSEATEGIAINRLSPALPHVVMLSCPVHFPYTPHRSPIMQSIYTVASSDNHVMVGVRIWAKSGDVSPSSFPTTHGTSFRGVGIACRCAAVTYMQRISDYMNAFMSSWLKCYDSWVWCYSVQQRELPIRFERTTRLMGRISAATWWDHYIPIRAQGFILTISQSR